MEDVAASKSKNEAVMASAGGGDGTLGTQPQGHEFNTNAKEFRPGAYEHLVAMKWCDTPLWEKPQCKLDMDSTHPRTISLDELVQDDAMMGS
eukprot:8117655-Karenia_brevis.AAC.1